MIKKIVLVSLSVLSMLSCFCNEVVKNDYIPTVEPEIVSIETTSVSMKWNNVGSEYTYNVVVGNVNDSNVIQINTNHDTTCVVNNLVSNKKYNVSVLTIREDGLRSLGNLITFTTK